MFRGGAEIKCLIIDSNGEDNIYSRKIKGIGENTRSKYNKQNSMMQCNFVICKRHYKCFTSIIKCNFIFFFLFQGMQTDFQWWFGEYSDDSGMYLAFKPFIVLYHIFYLTLILFLWYILSNPKLFFLYILSI